jgi:hypothetical protein
MVRLLCERLSLAAHGRQQQRKSVGRNINAVQAAEPVLEALIEVGRQFPVIELIALKSLTHFGVSNFCIDVVNSDQLDYRIFSRIP